MSDKYKTLVNAQRNSLESVLPLQTPYSVFIDVCNACNFRCKFCAAQYDGSRRGYGAEYMGLPLFEKIIDDMKSFGEKVKTLRLYGNGEPLLNKDFAAMARYAREAKVANWIETVTNGSRLSPELNRKLVRGG